MPGPGPLAHQVLVYAGPGISPLSLSCTLLTLSLVLRPNYTVQPVAPEVLKEEPWEPNTALLVIPGGRDLPYVEDLTARSNVTRRIVDYVRNGGRYLGICAGAYFGATECKFDVGGPHEVIGKRDLVSVSTRIGADAESFFPGTCAGPTFKGFDYGSERGAHAISLNVEGGKTLLELLYTNGGGHFIMPSPAPSNVEVLGRYAEPPASVESDVAVVLISEGQGKALLSSVHWEYPLEDPPALSAIGKRDTVPTAEHIEKCEKARVQWVRQLLSSVGLNVPARAGDGATQDGEEDPHLLLNPTHPAPIFAFSHPKLPELATGIFAAPSIQKKLEQAESGFQKLVDGNDTFNIGPVDAVGDVPAFLSKARRTEPVHPPALEDLTLNDEPPIPKPVDFKDVPKTVLLPGEEPYSPDWTPLFNFETYWAELDQARKESGRRTGVMRTDELSKGRTGERSSIGDVLFYGEAVTSTQTTLDRNPLILNGLKTPHTFLASFQLSGRGRGGNAWLSPVGCLPFTIMLTLPQSMVNKLIFVQYLAALAIAEALDPDGRLGVRIKWPNDVYAHVEGVGGTTVGGGKKGLAKIAGILVNTNYVNGQWRVLVGCGVNILNPLPTASLMQMHGLLTDRLTEAGLSSEIPPAPTMERSFARIMQAFEQKWEQFLNDEGFTSFMDEYKSRWLHSNQVVTLTTVTPHQKLKIVGITPDQGLLRCVPVEDSKLTPLYSRSVDGYADRTGNGLSGEFVDLQPDGNSFDLMSNMIKKKT